MQPRVAGGGADLLSDRRELQVERQKHQDHGHRNQRESDMPLNTTPPSWTFELNGCGNGAVDVGIRPGI